MKKPALNPEIQQATEYFQQGKFQEAIELLDVLIGQNPKEAFAWFLKGVIHAQQDFEAAKDALEKAIKYQPNYPEAYNNLGVICEKLDDIDAAKKAYEKAIIQNPNYANALYNLANIYKNEGSLQSALDLYHKAIKINPDYTNALVNLGVVYQTLRQYKKSLQYLREALSQQPNDIVTLNNLGLSYLYLYEYDKALDIFNYLNGLEPDLSTTKLNIAQVFEAMGNLDKAKEYYFKAAKDPQQKNTAFSNAGLLELSRLNFEEGWEYYRCRRSIQNLGYAVPKTLPESLVGKNILISKDQGLGDEIFFLRFLNNLQQSGANISYLSDSRLCHILQRSLPDIKVIDKPQALSSYDFVLPVSELPYLVSHTDQHSIPASIKLTANDSNIEGIKKSLPNNDKKNIAIAWQAGTEENNRLFKRIDPELLGKMFSNVDENIIVIQRDPSKYDIKRLEKALGRKSFNFSYVNNDLEDCLALLSVMDDFITVSNTNVHLAAAIGKSAKIFVPHPPEWRWTYAEETSPWFPDFSLFRQDNSGSWQEAINACQSIFENSLSY